MNSIVSLALLFAFVLCAPLASCQALTAGAHVLTLTNTSFWTLDGTDFAPAPLDFSGSAPAATLTINAGTSNDFLSNGITIDFGAITFASGFVNIGDIDFGTASLFFGPFTYTQSTASFMGLNAPTVTASNIPAIEFQGSTFTTPASLLWIGEFSRIIFNNSVITVANSQIFVAADLVAIYDSSFIFTDAAGELGLQQFSGAIYPITNATRIRNSNFTGAGNVGTFSFDNAPLSYSEFINVGFRDFGSVSLTSSTSSALGTTTFVINGLRTLASTTGSNPPSYYFVFGASGSNAAQINSTLSGITVDANAFSLRFYTAGSASAPTPLTVTGLQVNALIKDISYPFIIIDDARNTVNFPAASITSAEEIVVRGPGTPVFTNADVVSTIGSGAAITFADIVSLTFTNSRAIAATGAISITPVP